MVEKVKIRLKQGREPKICFTAIFRNESKNVNRCLDAAESIIDYVSIVDTGSTDDTVEKIEKWCLARKIPFKIHNEEFKNFGYNRTHSARKAIESFPLADYLLLIDADMVLKVEKTFSKRKLLADCYKLTQKSNLLSYDNIRLISTKLKWECVGVTHEYWETKQACISERLDDLWIDDREDGGCKTDKLERDERLLRSGLEDPKTREDIKSRYMFYLAETLRNQGKYAESINWYRKRIEAKGWEEELWYSLYRIGTSYYEMKKFDTAAGCYLEAWNRRPTRAEPLYDLTKMYREQKDKQLLAYTFAKIGKGIGYPKEDTLFIDHNIYNYLFDYEISIVGFYISEANKIGYETCLKLIENPTLTESLKDLIRNNAKCYKDSYGF